MSEQQQTDTLNPCPVCGGKVRTEDGPTFRWVRVCCEGDCGAEWELRKELLPGAWDAARSDVLAAIRRHHRKEAR